SRVPRKVLPGWLQGHSRKREWVFVVIQPGDDVDVYGTYWDGGTRRYYQWHDMKDGSVGGLHGLPPFSRVPGGAHQFQPDRGVLVVVTGTFCGKPATPEVYIRADDVRIFCGVSVDLDWDAPANAVADRAAELGQDATLYRLLMHV